MTEPASIRSRLRGLLEKLLLFTAATALVLLAGEAVVRWLAPQQLIQLRPDIWIPDYEGLGWRMAPHVDTWVNTGERDVHLETDADGHRIGADPVAPTDRRILALGDSFLAAIEVSYDDTMTARLEQSLSAATGERLRVVNTGVGGWGPDHYVLKARAELARRPYELVLIFLFRGNDVLEKRREAHPPKQAEVVHRLRLPQSFGPRELVSAWLYPINDSLERRSHFFMLARNQLWYLLMSMGLSARGFPAAELRSEARTQRWRVTGELCADIAAEAGAHGLDALFVLLPGAYHVDPDLGYAYASAIGLSPDEVDLGQSSRLLTEELARRGLRFLDVTASLKALRAQGTLTHGKVDTHLSPTGHAAIARQLHQPVLELLAEAKVSPRPQPAAPRRGSPDSL